MEKVYDTLIIGAGPAGITAGLYASRGGMDALLLSEAIPGGQLMFTAEIENYPGFKNAVTGPELIEHMLEQARKNNINTVSEKVVAIEKKKNFEVKTDNAIYKTHSVIIATGAVWRKLGVKGEEEFMGKGVSYCGVCDAPMFKNKEIALIGGGDTAVEEALYLTKFCSKLHLIHRRDRLRATKVLQDRVLKNPKIVVHWNCTVKEIYGDKSVQGIEVENLKTGQNYRIACQGAFIFVGIKPNSELVKGLARLDENGYILTDESMKTSSDGLFAAGDVRKKPLRQISTAVGEGATAAFCAQQYVEGLLGKAYV